MNRTAFVIVVGLGAIAVQYLVIGVPVKVYKGIERAKTRREARRLLLVASVLGLVYSSLMCALLWRGYPSAASCSMTIGGSAIIVAGWSFYVIRALRAYRGRPAC